LARRFSATFFPISFSAYFSSSIYFKIKVAIVLRDSFDLFSFANRKVASFFPSFETFLVLSSGIFEAPED